MADLKRIMIPLNQIGTRRLDRRANTLYVTLFRIGPRQSGVLYLSNAGSGHSVCAKTAAKTSRLRLDGGTNTRAGNRRNYGDLYSFRPDALKKPAGRGSHPAGYAPLFRI